MMSVYGVCCHVMSRHHYDRKAPDVQAVGPHCAPGAVKMLRQRVDALFAEDRVDEVMSALALQSITTIDDLASRLHLVSLPPFAVEKLRHIVTLTATPGFLPRGV